MYILIFLLINVHIPCELSSVRCIYLNVDIIVCNVLNILYYI